MPIAKITKPVCQTLREELEAAMAPVAAKHGINIATGRGTFSDAEFTLKVILTTKGEGGVDQGAKKRFEQLAHAVGLKPEDFGREILLDHERFRIADINPRASAKPVLVERLSDGKRFKIAAEAVQVRLPGAAT